MINYKYLNTISEMLKNSWKSYFNALLYQNVKNISGRINNSGKVMSSFYLIFFFVEL